MADWSIQRIFVKNAAKLYKVRPHVVLFDRTLQCAAAFLVGIWGILVRIFYLAISYGPRITILSSGLVYKFR